MYRSGQVPTGVGNWLLDLELAYGVFTADRTALITQDLGLTGDGIDEVVRAHEKFFNAAKRVDSLKALLSRTMTPRSSRPSSALLSSARKSTACWRSPARC